MGKHNKDLWKSVTCPKEVYDSIINAKNLSETIGQTLSRLLKPAPMVETKPTPKVETPSEPMVGEYKRNLRLALQEYGASETTIKKMMEKVFG